ncbi:glycosyltransferase [Patescibacteria group bacterium]|nr:glycosyltransferase [Patescibacteria group bacterium]
MKQKIDIILPVYNEEKVLRHNTLILLDFLKNNLSAYDFQIVITDNNSKDNTKKIGLELANIDGIGYIFTHQQGRGVALKKAFYGSRAEFCFYMDIDLATDLSALPNMIDMFVQEKYDIVVGSRFLPESKIERSLLREVLSRGYMQWAKFQLKINISDLQCGFKGINRRIINEVVPRVQDNNWFFDTELLTLASRDKKYKIKEIPIKWIEQRNYSRKSKVKLLKTIVEYIKSVNRIK